MLGFEEISNAGGVDLQEASGPYMTVPKEGTNYIFRILSSKGAGLPTDPAGFVHVTDVTDDLIHQWATIVGGLSKDYAESLKKSLASSFKDKRILSVTSKVPGTYHLTANGGDRRPTDRLNVAVLKPKTFTVAFRFVEYKDVNGKRTGGSKFTPDVAAGKIAWINDIYWQQAAVTFELKSAEPLPLTGQFESINNAVIYSTLQWLVDKEADTTVFMVPNLEKGGKGGTSIRELKLAVVSDEGDKQISDGSDPNTLTIAHELAHCLGRGDDVYDRNGVLLSSGKQSAKIIKEVVDRINPPPDNAKPVRHR